MHSCIPNSVIENSLKLERGFKVKLKLKRSELEGVIIEQNLDEIHIQVENKVRRIKASQIQDVALIEKVELPHNPYIKAKQTALEKFNKQLTKIPKSLANLQLSITQEVEYLRTLSSKESRTAYLREMGDEIEKKIKRKLHSDNLGYHFNLNGGLDYEYAQSGGIFINRGDIFAQHGIGTHTAENVYFFQSKQVGLYDLINSYDMRKIIERGRMGDVLMIFNLDHPYFARAIQEKGITQATEIFYDFNPAWLRKQPFNNPEGGRMIGVPAETFVIPPMPIYRKAHYRELGLKNLSREEQNLIYMRLIENLVLGS